MDTQRDLVSIITPSYNSERFISQSIESVLAQTYPHWEMLIIDDKSQDDSNKIVERYMQKDNRIKLIKMDNNSGPAIARNKGIELAQGRYIAFLDSDDVWLPEKLETQIKFMKENNVQLCYASYYIIDGNGAIKSIFNIPKKRVNYRDLLKTSIIGNLTAVVDVQSIGKFYMEDVGHEDYTLWLKILKHIDYAYGIDEPLAKYRILSRSISRNKLKTASWQWNVYRNIEKLDLISSIYYFIHYTWNGIKKSRIKGLEDSPKNT